MSLVTLEAAKRHLYITDPSRDAAVTEKIAQASDAMLTYLGAQGDPAWNETTTPPLVQAATLQMVGYLYQGWRVDPPAADADIWSDIKNTLMQLRDPALA